MALAANAIRSLAFLGAGHSVASLTVTNGQTIYKGSLVGLDLASGHVRPWNDAAGYVFVGIALEKVVGDGTERCTVSVGPVLVKSATITLTSAAADNGRPVYASDDDTFTMTRPSADASPVGYLERFISVTSGDIVLFSRAESMTLGLAGGNKTVRYIGRVDLTQLSGSADLITNIPLFGHGKIVDFFAVVEKVSTDAAAAVALNLEINTVDVTGGVISITDTADTGAGGFIDTLGHKFSSTAITAANEYHDGDTLSVEASGLTAYASGEIGLYIVVENLPGN